ncbi:MAG TPA: queuosine precursor transporter [Bacteroidales bacterium]|nr:queuosine precursor transporter [Bacteroidales bacterium]
MKFKSLRKSNSHRRDALFLFLVSIFLTSLVLGNIVGTTKFVTLFTLDMPTWLQSITPALVRDGSIYVMSVPIGLLAYPFTFLATDLISELFGRKRAQTVVWIGFIMNLFVLFILSLGHWFPDTYGVSGGLNLFEGVYDFVIANTVSSMIAYLIAQSVDVRIFHYLKRLTDGKYLWLRNNGSTMFSQLIDSTTILTILYLSGNLGDNVTTIGALLILIVNSYLFKFFFALFDTPLAYLGVWVFQDYEEDPEGKRLYATAVRSN